MAIFCRSGAFRGSQEGTPQVGTCAAHDMHTFEVNSEYARGSLRQWFCVKGRAHGCQCECHEDTVLSQCKVKLHVVVARSRYVAEIKP